jgi:hypothetical protein
MSVRGRQGAAVVMPLVCPPHYTPTFFFMAFQGLPTRQNGDLTGEIWGYDYRYNGIVLEYD